MVLVFPLAAQVAVLHRHAVAAEARATRGFDEVADAGDPAAAIARRVGVVAHVAIRVLALRRAGRVVALLRQPERGVAEQRLVDVFTVASGEYQYERCTAKPREPH